MRLSHLGMRSVSNVSGKEGLLISRRNGALSSLASRTVVGTMIECFSPSVTVTIGCSRVRSPNQRSPVRGQGSGRCQRSFSGKRTQPSRELARSAQAEERQSWGCLMPRAGGQSTATGVSFQGLAIARAIVDVYQGQADFVRPEAPPLADFGQSNAPGHASTIKRSRMPRAAGAGRSISCGGRRSFRRS